MVPLFDLGNVIVKVDFTPFLNWIGDAEGKFLRSSLHYDLEFGSIGREEFSKRMSELYGVPANEVAERFCGIFTGPVEGMIDLLANWDQPAYALSNTNEIHLEWLWREMPEVLKHFSKVFASSELKLRKPYPGIYLDVAQAIGVEPQEILFFDDLSANVDGARRVGLNAHLFTEAGQVRDLLKQIQGSDDRTKHGGF